MKEYKTARGFAALVSVLIISAILVALTLTVSTSSLFTRADLLDTENKAAATNLARGCVEAALLKYAENKAYTPPEGGERVVVEEGSECVILSLTQSENELRITTSAVVRAAHTLLVATAVPNEKSISVREVASL